MFSSDVKGEKKRRRGKIRWQKVSIWPAPVSWPVWQLSQQRLQCFCWQAKSKLLLSPAIKLKRLFFSTPLITSKCKWFNWRLTHMRWNQNAQVKRVQNTWDGTPLGHNLGICAAKKYNYSHKRFQIYSTDNFAFQRYFAVQMRFATCTVRWIKIYFNMLHLKTDFLLWQTQLV